MCKIHAACVSCLSITRLSIGLIEVIMYTKTISNIQNQGDNIIGKRNASLCSVMISTSCELRYQAGFSLYESSLYYMPPLMTLSSFLSTAIAIELRNKHVSMVINLILLFLDYKEISLQFGYFTALCNLFINSFSYLLSVSFYKDPPLDVWDNDQGTRHS